MKGSPILSCSPWLFSGKGLSLPVFASSFVVVVVGVVVVAPTRYRYIAFQLESSSFTVLSGSSVQVEVAYTWPSRAPSPRMVLTVSHSQCGRKATWNLNSWSFSAEAERRPELFPQKRTNARAVNGLTFSVNGMTVNGPLPYRQRIDSVCVME